MILYLLKRLILTIPVLFLISFITFLLLNSLLDSIVQSEMAGIDWNNFHHNAQTMEERQRSILEKYNFDKPLFYFSLHNATLRDSLYGVCPPVKKRFVRNICESYGDGKVVRDFLDHLETEIVQNPQLAEVYLSKNEKDLEEKLLKLPFSENEIVTRDFQRLKNSPPNYLTLIPEFTWNGRKNRYHMWLNDLSKGDLGRSIADGLPVRYRLFPALKISFVLGSLSLIILFSTGLLFGILLSRYQEKLNWIPQILYIINAMPLFWIGELLIVLFASKSFLYLFPSFGIRTDNSIDLKYLVLPVSSLVISALPIVAMQTKAAFDKHLSQPYILMARVKGLSQKQIFFKHLLRNAINPIITIFTSFLPATVGGIMIVEYVYSIPGMGRLLIEAIGKNDFPLILIIIILIGIIKILSNILADFTYRFADPRISFK